MIHHHRLPIADLAFEQLPAEDVFDLFLNGPFQGPSAVRGIATQGAVPVSDGRAPRDRHENRVKKMAAGDVSIPGRWPEGNPTWSQFCGHARRDLPARCP